VEHRARCIEGAAPVFPIADDRMTEMGEARADLVEEARLELDLDEGRRGEGADRRHVHATAPTGLADLDAGRMMAHDGEGQLDGTRALDATLDEGEIALLDAVIGEGPSQSAPDVVVEGEEQRAGRVDVEAMDDARAQTALADADDLGMSGDDGVQDRVALIRIERMHAAAGRLVDDQPAASLGDDAQRKIGPRLGALLVGVQGAEDAELVAGRREPRLVREREGLSGLDDPADLEEMADPGAGDREPQREEAIESLPALLGSYPDDRRLQTLSLASPGHFARTRIPRPIPGPIGPDPTRPTSDERDPTPGEPGPGPEKGGH
jgi:hypothetical protein